MAREIIPSGPWQKGVNSVTPPQLLPDEQLQWSVNTINRGGYATRPGFRCLIDQLAPRGSEPRGLAAFTPRGQAPHLVKAYGSILATASISPSISEWSILIDIGFGGPVYFESCIKGIAYGSTIVEPYPVLIIQTGSGPPLAWDGTSCRVLQEFECPAGTVMKWFGSRLWVAVGPRLYASDLLDPVARTETDLLTGGGYLQFNGNITGLATTSDNQFLIVFTDNQTSAIQGSILDRTLWGQTIGFQKILFEEIGCIAPKSIVNQYGMLWWMSQNGLCAIDQSLQSYRSSRLKYRDGNMARAKSNMSSDKSGIAGGAFENFLLMSVPSGDTWNNQTLVMDQLPEEVIEQDSPAIWASSWTGIRPVQWVRITVDGNPRIFCLSRDYKITGDTGADFSSNVWECFTKDRVDVGVDVVGNPVIKPIRCSIETKLLSKSGGYNTYGHAEILVRGLAGRTHFDAFYESSHSAYKQVLSKDVVATTSSLYSAEDLPSVLPSYLPQTRRIKTSEDEAQLSDLDAGVEDVYTRNKDRAFSVLVRWDGIATIWMILLVLDQRDDDVTGKREENETTDRFVEASGNSKKLDTLNTFQLTPFSESAPVAPNQYRSADEFYSSMP